MCRKSGAFAKIIIFIISVKENFLVYTKSDIAKVNDLFEGGLTGDDKLVHANNVLKGKLLESEILRCCWRC